MKTLHLFPLFYLTLGWFGIEMAMALDVTLFQVMLEKQLDNALMIGLVLGLGPLAGIIIQPLIGWYGDTLASKGFSRKRLMKIGIVAALISLIGLSLPLGLGGLVGMIALFFAGLNILIVCYRAFVTETTARKAIEKRKGSVSGFIALFSALGGFAMFLLCGAVGTSPYPFWAGAAMLVLTFYLFFRYAPQPKADRGDTLAHAGELFRPLNLLFYAMPLLGLVPRLDDAICRYPFQRPIFRLFLVIFLTWIGIQALRGFFVLYVTKSLALSEETSYAMLAMITLVMVLAAIPFGRLADRMDNTRLYRYCLLSFSLMCLGGYYWVDSTFSLAVLCILMGISFAGLVVCPLSSLFRLCPANNEGAYAGLYNLFISVPQLYSLVLAGWLIDLAGDYRMIQMVSFFSVLGAFWASFRMDAERPGLAEKLP